MNIDWETAGLVALAAWLGLFGITFAAQMLRRIFGRTRHRDEEPVFPRPPRPAPRKPLTPEEIARARRFAKVITDGPQPPNS